jgi:hypothetical protein
MTTKHTPGMLYVDECGPAYGLYRKDTGGCVVADLDKDYASRLALCWNMHDELVAALKQTDSALEVAATPLAADRQEVLAARQAARAVLAKLPKDPT